jgi:hypothetical protein
VTTETTAPADYDRYELAKHLGLADWQFTAGRRFGLIPASGLDKRWSAAAAAELVWHVDEILAAVGTEHPIGALRSAERLAERSGLKVSPVDVDVLARRGALTVAMVFRKKGRSHDLYAPAQLDRLVDEQAEVLAAVVTERTDWLAASITAEQAAEVLSWRRRELQQVAEERGLQLWLDRYACADIEALAADEELCARVAADRLLGPDQAATRLEIRRTDWDYVVAGGWISPRKTTWMPVGRKSEVKVPMYRTADIDALLEIPGVDWDAVRACRKGDPSPLRELVGGRLPARGEVVRRWIAELGDRYDIDVWAVYRPGSNKWEINWEMPNGKPTKADVAELIDADLVIGQYRSDLVLSTKAGVATRWARAMLEPDAAVILDTETTDLDGSVIEIAVIDACTGKILLNSLVNPGDVPIAPGAYAVHGISAQRLVNAPTWEKVLPKLRKVTRGRTILAYNSDFDRRVILGDTRRAGRKPMHLEDRANWGCLMNRRSDWLGTSRWLRLGGGHRALGDCQAAREVLIDIAQLTRSDAA